MFITIKRKAILSFLVALIVFAILGVSVGATNSAGVYLGHTNRKLPIYSVSTDKPKIALSFDAAWGADRTQLILDTLTENKVKATFFLVGFWADKYPEMVNKIDLAGMEIGGHSNTHPNMGRLSESQIRLELETSNQKIEKITSKKVELFRPPFGDYSDRLLTVTESLNLYTIQWDVDTLDWKDLSARAIAERVLSKAKNGSIVLMHNDGKHTAEALPLIIAGLINKGYELVTIGDLIYRSDYTIDNNGTQQKNP